MKAREDKEMNGSCRPVARVLPLPQPELQGPRQSGQWPVKTKITFTPKERRQAFCHDKGKTSDTANMNDKNSTCPQIDQYAAGPGVWMPSNMAPNISYVLIPMDKAFSPRRT